MYVTKQKGHASSVRMVVETSLNQYRQEGYLLAACDTVFFSADSLIILIDKQIKFEAMELSLDAAFCNVYTSLCTDLQKVIHFPLRPQSIAKLHGTIERHFEDQGFPFMSFEYDSVQIKGGHIKAKLLIEPSHKFYFDTLVLSNATRSKNGYLQALLGIRKGAVYSRKKILDIQRLINQTGFLELKSEPYLSFRFDKAYVHLDVKEKSLTRINGFVGLVPDKTPHKNTIAGELDLSFRNLFGYGVNYKLDWKRFQSRSQNANMQVVVPFLLKSPVGVNATLDILKQDSSFVNINRKLEFGYRLNRLVHMSLGYQYYSSSVNSGLKEYMGIKASKMQQYGLGINVNTINDVFFPTKGLFVEASIYGGQKNLNTVRQDSLPKFSTQFNISFGFDKVLKLALKSALVFKSSSKALINSKNALYVNDLFRLGGINTLRGFGENAFYANAYTYAALEYRILTSKDAYGVVFMNTAALQNQLVKEVEYPIGGGVGYVFKTQIGVFQFFYSLGKSKVDAIALENSKVHIAITNDF